MRKAVVRDWVETEPKVREWADALAKKAKATGRNYSRLLYLYWTRNQRFRSFKSTAQWLDEVREQQDSPDITVRRAWGRNSKPSTYPTKASPARSLPRLRTTSEPQSSASSNSTLATPRTTRLLSEHKNNSLKKPVREKQRPHLLGKNSKHSTTNAEPT